MTDERDPFDDFINSLGEHDDAPPPNPRFVRTLRGDLMKQAATMPAAPLPSSDKSFRGSLSAPISFPHTRARRFDRRLALQLAAVAALLLAWLGTLAGGGPDRVLNSAFQNDDPAAVSAVMYRGDAARTGVYSEEAPKQTPEMAWSVDLHEKGFIATVGDSNRIIFLNYISGTVLSLDPANGEEQWRVDIGCITIMTPVLTEDSVYLASSRCGPGESGYLVALNAETGVARWQFETGGSSGSSPVLADSVVYIIGTEREMTLYAIDSETGEERWHAQADAALPAPTDAVASPASQPSSQDAVINVPFSPAVADGTVYTTFADGTLHALDATTGETQWEFASGANALHAVTVADGIVYLNAASVADPDVEGWLIAIDAATGDEAWRIEQGRRVQYVSTVVADGRIFFSGDEETGDATSAFNAATGDQLWSIGVVGSSFYADGLLYIADADGVIHAINPETGDLVWSAFTGGSPVNYTTITDPVLSNGQIVYMGEDNHAIALREGAGEVGTPMETNEPADVSGLPLCEPVRAEPVGPFTGTPEASVVPVGDNANGQRNENEILLSEIPDGPAASPEVEAAITETLSRMAACVDRRETTASFFTDDFFRRAWVTWDDEGFTNLGFTPLDDSGELFTDFNESRLLDDGRVALIKMYSAEHGWLLIFRETEDGWLIDELAPIVPELGGRG